MTSGDSLGVVADAMARAEQTLDLAARHLDPSLVDVLGILGFDTAVRLGARVLSVRRGGSRVSRLPQRRGLREPRPQPSRRARGPAGDARRGPPRRRADPLLAAGGHARRGAVAASAAGARRGVLREHGRRGGRLGDEVRARGDRPAAADLLRQQLSRRHARAAVARRRRVLQGGLRPAAAGLRARSVRRPRAPGGGSCARRTSPRSSSSRSRAAW